MTQRGGIQRPWTSDDRRYLAEHAGRVPLRDLCAALGRSEWSVRHAAARLGLSLRVPAWGLAWCDECACWRSSVDDATGRCPVCEMRARIAGREAACAAELALMDPAQRAAYSACEARRGRRKRPAPPPPRPNVRGMGWAEAVRAERRWHLAEERWELAALKLDYDAAKTRLKRMREKTGRNPRKGRGDSVDRKTSGILPDQMTFSEGGDS